MHNAYLYIDEFKFPIKYLEYNFRQFTGTNNKPNTRVFGGEFTFTFDIDDKKAIHLIEWMLSSSMQKNGYIEIMDFNQTSIAFKLEFANAYATSLLLHYDANSNLPLQSNVRVTAGAMRFNKDVTYLQTWNKDNPFTENKAVTNIEADVEGIIIESHLEDQHGNKIIKPKQDQKILLIIETENMTGKSIDIDLSDSDIDFEYQGNILINDILNDFNVTTDLMKISLIARKPK